MTKTYDHGLLQIKACIFCLLVCVICRTMRQAYLKQGGSNTTVLARMSELEQLVTGRDVNHVTNSPSRVDEYTQHQQREYAQRIAELEREMRQLKDRARIADDKRADFTREQYTASSDGDFRHTKRPRPFLETTTRRVSLRKLWFSLSNNMIQHLFTFCRSHLLRYLLFSLVGSITRLMMTHWVRVNMMTCN